PSVVVPAVVVRLSLYVVPTVVVPSEVVPIVVVPTVVVPSVVVPAVVVRLILAHTDALLSLCADCREEMYPCTRMYSVHGPTRKCIGGFCLYSLQRMYVINKEICTRTVCSQDEYMKGQPLVLCKKKELDSGLSWIKYL
uniref:Uncharacterized protein n=1 Tax=Periophthalmus magnuspinnatus TaxID=409849 RepID=A0A3B4AMJ1_9GOBI